MEARRGLDGPFDGGTSVHPIECRCTDALACNYNAASSVDDGSCIYGTEVDGLGLVYNCDGACFADTDGDGVCDALKSTDARCLKLRTSILRPQRTMEAAWLRDAPTLTLTTSWLGQLRTMGAAMWKGAQTPSPEPQP